MRAKDNCSPGSEVVGEWVPRRRHERGEEEGRRQSAAGAVSGPGELGLGSGLARQGRGPETPYSRSRCAQGPKGGGKGSQRHKDLCSRRLRVTARGGSARSPRVPTPATRPPEGRSESQLESPFAGGGGLTFVSRGGGAGGAGGEEPGNRASRALRRMAGTKGADHAGDRGTRGSGAEGRPPDHTRASLLPPGPCPSNFLPRRPGRGWGARRGAIGAAGPRPPHPPTPARPPRAHLARQLPAPLGPRASERLDPRHGRGGGGGRSRDRKAARARGPAQFLKREPARGPGAGAAARPAARPPARPPPRRPRAPCPRRPRPRSSARSAGSPAARAARAARPRSPLGAGQGEGGESRGKRKAGLYRAWRRGCAPESSPASPPPRPGPARPLLPAPPPGRPRPLLRGCREAGEVLPCLTPLPSAVTQAGASGLDTGPPPAGGSWGLARLPARGGVDWGILSGPFAEA